MWNLNAYTVTRNDLILDPRNFVCGFQFHFYFQFVYRTAALLMNFFFFRKTQIKNSRFQLKNIHTVPIELKWII